MKSKARDRAEREELADAAMNKKLREVKQRYLMELLRIPGVVLVGLGSNYFRVFFDGAMEGADMGQLPNGIEGIPVKVIPYVIPKETQS